VNLFSVIYTVTSLLRSYFKHADANGGRSVVSFDFKLRFLGSFMREILSSRNGDAGAPGSGIAVFSVG